MNKGKKRFFDIICGAFIGIVNGFLGSGGGMIAVPILEKLKKITNKEAHATALVVILPLSIVSAVVYSFNFELNWLTILILSLSVTAGGVLGSFFLKKLSCKVIRLIFAILMFGAGLYLLVTV